MIQTSVFGKTADGRDVIAFRLTEDRKSVV